MFKFKAYQSTISPVNLMMIAVLFQVILFLGYYILLGGFKLVEDVLYLLVVDAKIFRCISDGDFTLDDFHEW